jgi:FkbM family methyltransferase
MALGSRLRLALARVPPVYRWSRRAVVLSRYAARRPHEPDFAFFARFKDEDRAFLDVGANLGQSAISFRTFQKRAPILSIEANPLCEPDLRFLRRILPRFDYVIAAASDSPGSLDLHVPTYRGIAVPGEASLDPEDAADPYWLEAHGGDASQVGTIAVRTKVIRLDELEVDPAFVKVDVEGHEAQALTGLQATLDRCRPIVMVESSESAEAVDAVMAGRRYDPYVYDPDGDRLTRPGSRPSLNRFFVPAERAAELVPTD